MWEARGLREPVCDKSVMHRNQCIEKLFHAKTLSERASDKASERASERASDKASDKGGNYGSITFDNRNI